MSDMLRICQSLMSHLCHWFNEPVSKNRIFTVQLLTSIVAGCKPAAPNPLFKSLVSGSQAICKTDKTRIPLLCGCLQRDTAFVVSEGQRPQGSGHLTWDCRGGILLIYTYNGLYSMCRRLKKMHFWVASIKKHNISRTLPYQLSIKIILLRTVRHQPITTCAIFAQILQ